MHRPLAATDPEVIAEALLPAVGEDRMARLRARVAALAAQHPLYPDLMEDGR